MGLRSGSISRVWHIASTATSTIVRKTRISRPASESGGGRGVNPQGTRNVSSPRMVPSANTSDRNATGSPPPSTAKRWVNDSRSGRRSWARPWPCKGGVRHSPPIAAPGDVVGTNKMPWKRYRMELAGRRQAMRNRRACLVCVGSCSASSASVASRLPPNTVYSRERRAGNLLSRLHGDIYDVVPSADQEEDAVAALHAPERRAVLAQAIDLLLVHLDDDISLLHPGILRGAALPAPGSPRRPGSGARPLHSGRSPASALALPSPAPLEV